jgi:nucleoside-diphosphate-sugar epimerase
MKIFITGGTGFIGRRLIDRLARDKNNQLICLTRNLSKAVIPAAENVQFIEGEISNPETYKDYLQNSDILYHLAAHVKYGLSPNEKKENFQTNVIGTKKIFQTALEFKIPRVIYLSSAVIYHPCGNGIPDESDNPPDKHITEYSKTKYLGFLEAQKFISKGLAIITLLPTSVYGCGSPLFTDFIKFLFKHKIFFKPLLDKKLSTVYVADVVNAILLASTSEKTVGSYIISDKIITVRDLIKMTEKHFHIKIRIFNVPLILLKSSIITADFLCQYIGINKYINKEIFALISNNFVACGDKVKRELKWHPSPFKETFYETFKQLYF